MKHLTLTSLKAVLTASLIFTFSLSAQTTDCDGTGAGTGQGQETKGFVDQNNDGINDNAKDTDGDGIPNGKDADYKGTFTRAGHGVGGFVDEDGDGINDNAFDEDGDGIPNGMDEDFIRKQDGSGRMNKFGSASGKGSMNKGAGMGTGTCDGIGAKGTAKKYGKNR